IKIAVHAVPGTFVFPDGTGASFSKVLFCLSSHSKGPFGTHDRRSRDSNWARRGPKVLATELRRSHRQLRSANDHPHWHQFHWIGLAGRNRFELDELPSRRTFGHWLRNLDLAKH